MATTPLQELEGAERSYERVRAEMDALEEADLSALNVDVVSASSVAQGVAERLTAYRDRMAKLPEFDLRSVDNLVDYAKAAWFVHITNLPVQGNAEAISLKDLTEEVTGLRARLMMWAVPLVGSGFFEEAAIARIREGGGAKDAASDVVALVGLYRASWDSVKGICGVREEDLLQGSRFGPELFARLSRRDFPTLGASEGMLRVRRAWTLLDRAYMQCRRALAYLCAEDQDVNELLPSLRRNWGGIGRPHPPETKPETTQPETPAEGTTTPTATPGTIPPASGSRSVEGAPVINAGAPFAKP